MVECLVTGKDSQVRDVEVRVINQGKSYTLRQEVETSRLLWHHRLIYDVPRVQVTNFFNNVISPKSI